MSGSFYNTTHESGTVLKKNMSKAAIQDAIVLSFFKKYPDKEFTPLEVWQARFDDSTPITSVRRSMTDLTNSKPQLLEKTKTKRPGGHGRPNYCWKLFIPEAPKEFVQAKLF